MENKVVRLTEQDINQIIKESVEKIINENMEQEGFWDNVKAGAKGFMGKDINGIQRGGKGAGFSQLGRRYNAMKKNYQMKGQYDEIQKVADFLNKQVQNKKLDPNMTIAQLIGGAINGNKFGVLSGMANNRLSQSSRASRMD